MSYVHNALFFYLIWWLHGYFATLHFSLQQLKWDYHIPEIQQAQRIRSIEMWKLQWVIAAFNYHRTRNPFLLSKHSPLIKMLCNEEVPKKKKKKKRIKGDRPLICINISFTHYSKTIVSLWDLYIYIYIIV